MPVDELLTVAGDAGITTTLLVWGEGGERGAIGSSDPLSQSPGGV